MYKLETTSVLNLPTDVLALIFVELDLSELRSALFTCMYFGRAFKKYELRERSTLLAKYMKVILDNPRYLNICAVPDNYRTLEICMAAVKTSVGNIYLCPVQSLEMCETAVSMSPPLLKHCNFQTQEMCMVAVEYYPQQLKYVKDQTFDLCMLAWNINVNDFYCIKRSRFLTFIKCEKLRQRVDIALED